MTNIPTNYARNIVHKSAITNMVTVHNIDFVSDKFNLEFVFK